MTAGLKITSFRSHDVNDGVVYECHMILDEGFAYDTFTSTTIEAERPDNFPVWVRNQPDGIRFGIRIYIKELNQFNLDKLKQWWSPFDLPAWLVVSDNMGDEPYTSRRIELVVERLAPVEGNNVFVATVRASTGLWESSEGGEIDTVSITASGQEFSLPNSGSAPYNPIIDLTPKNLVASTDGWNKRRFLVVVNRADDSLGDYLSRDYPILIGDVTDFGLTPGNDIRILLDGEDQPRWFEGNKLWTLLGFRPSKTFTLAFMLNNSLTDTPVIANNTEGLRKWLGIDEGFFLIDDEAIFYRGVTSSTITPVQRGCLGTSAASHSANATAYWIEHPDLFLLSNFSLADSPLEPDNLKPVFDLASSDNDHWVWTNPYFADPSEARAGTWRRDYVEDNANSPHIRAYESSGMVFENAEPETDKVLANNATMEAPCEVASITATVSDTAGTPIPLEGYGWRRIVSRTTFTYDTSQTGVESIQTGSTVSQESSDGGGTPSDGDTITNAIVPVFTEFPVYESPQTGSSTSEVSSTFLPTRGADSENTVYKKVRIGTDVQQTGSSVYAVTEVIGHPDESTFGTAPTFSVFPRYQSVPDYTTNTSFSQEKGTLSEITSFTFRTYGVDKEGYEGLITLGASLGVPIFRVRFNAFIPIGRDLDGNYFTSPPAIVETGSGMKASVTGVTINFNTAKTPRIIVSAEEDMYFIRAIITHGDSGDYIQLVVPAAIDDDIRINCINHTVLGLNDREIPAEVLASNTRDWLAAKPGMVNTFSLDMDGIGGGNGHIDVDASYTYRWL